MTSPVEQIKEKLSVVDVIGSYLKLQKAGANYKAVCPFHHENTPSFFVSPERNSFYCFGCGAKGDVISFVEQFEGLDFMGALKLLAERAGIPLVFQPNAERSANERSYKLLEEATLFFQGELKKNVAAVEYLKKRGITDVTMQAFRLGFAPEGWHTVSLYLRNKGFRDSEIEKVGLSKKTEKGYYDRFRSRIMFPLADAAARTVGFSGRIFGKEDETAAKYVNSPETSLFQKSKLLFGYDKAKLAIRKAERVVVVEGQMDLVMSQQAGVVNTVAVSGTALTENHLETLGRLAHTIVLAFDADSAGFRAALRSARLALSRGLEVKVAVLPEKLDPADLVLKDKEAWQKAVSEATPLIDFLIGAVSRQAESPTELRKSMEETVLPYVATLKSTIEQAQYVNKIAARLGVSEEPVWTELRKRASVGESEEKPLPAKNTLRPIRQGEIVKRLFGILLWQEKKTGADIPPEKLRGELQRVLEDRYSEERIKAEGEEQTLILEAEVLYGASVSLSADIKELLLQLEEDILKEKLKVATMALRRLEEEKAGDLIAAQLALCQKISAALQTISTQKERLAV